MDNKVYKRLEQALKISLINKFFNIHSRAILFFLFFSGLQIESLRADLPYLLHKHISNDIS